ncbi:MAG: hypothetical protein KBA66_04075 [Leptospiraceae bacterium]|nr:hypothetical protein [Leptospiraceae bacterium]
MILIGLLFFVFASLGPELVASSKKPNNKFTPKTQVVRNSPRATKKVLFNFRYPEQRGSKEVEKRIRQERKMAPTQFKRRQEESELEMPTLDEVPEENSISSFYTASHTRIVNPIHETQERIETIPMEEESFTIELNGLLFLDYSRSIPFQTKELKSILWSESMFQNFKRIGIARIQHKNKSFRLITGNLSHEYSFSEIEEVVFFDEAFSIIPKKRILPIPLIFSEEVGKLKAAVTRNRPGLE